MFTNQSILETNADPYPSLISVIGQVPYLEPGQLFFYLFAIIIFTFLLGLMNAANTAFNSITDSNIFQLKKSEESQIRDFQLFKRQQTFKLQHITQVILNK